mmetsp:Transcript_494/g.1208  ORF Transcript_494/g.1208 Transcript_494/m.1208 type:complete len:503 (+) Transcript_494:82-1590(+)
MSQPSLAGLRRQGQNKADRQGFPSEASMAPTIARQNTTEATSAKPALAMGGTKASTTKPAKPFFASMHVAKPSENDLIVQEYLHVKKDSRASITNRYTKKDQDHCTSISNYIELLRAQKLSVREIQTPAAKPEPMQIEDDDMDVSLISETHGEAPKSTTSVAPPLRSTKRNRTRDSLQEPVPYETLASLLNTMSFVSSEPEEAIMHPNYTLRTSSTYTRDSYFSHIWQKSRNKTFQATRKLLEPLPVPVEEPKGPQVNLTPAFTEEEEDMYDAAMNSSDDNKVLVQRFNVDLMAQQMYCLEGLQWLNDEVINFYLSLLRERSLHLVETNATPGLSCYFHLTLFYSKLTENNKYNYKGVQRWTKRGFRKCDLFTQDIVFFPRNIGNSHWTLCVAFIKEKRVEYFDSMAGVGRECMQNILHYLRDEHADKKGSELDTSDWELIDHGPNVPQQNNGSDCGVFLCTFCNFLSMGQPLDFEAKDMPYMRKRIAIDCLKAASSYEIQS